MHHRLLVAGRHEAHALLVDRLADAREVAVAEDAEGAREEARRHPVSLDRLRAEEANQRLRDRQAYDLHLTAPIVEAHEVALHDQGAYYDRRRWNVAIRYPPVTERSD